jgi:hypothetical protein
MNRRSFLAASAALVSAASAGSGESDAASRTTAAPVPAEPSRPPPPGGLAPAPLASQRLSTLTLVTPQSGTLPYLATVYPLEGAVPAGTTVVSQDDQTLAASVLSRWPDGSAAVVVVAGETTLAAATPRSIVLTSAAAGGAASLTPARIGALVKRVDVDGGPLGTASIGNFAAPERVWWANPRVVCARYRAPIGAALEAVIDIHAFASDHALVEVVVENGRIDARATSPARPATQSYAGATVSVNGQDVATVASPSSGQAYRSGASGGRYQGGHEAFRAWYCATWIGGDPRVEVTHDAESLQTHPLFFRCWRAASDDYRSAYQNDLYAPWSCGRLNVPSMPRGGDMEAVGPLTQWDARYLQTGSRFVRRAVVASALGALSCNVNVRDASGRIPTHAQANGKSQNDGNWPRTATEPAWELAHHPAVGLMAFLCQPSPAFIEIAQKIAIWNATTLRKDGVFGFWSQVRGKAWGIRSLAHAIFLTPDGDPWKDAARASLAANARQIDAFRTSPNATLGFVWHADPTRCGDFEQRNEGMQQPLWMHHFLVLSLHAAERARVLGGADQALLKTVTDWAATQPVRYVNEAPNGEWRLQNYLTVVGRATVVRASAENLGSGIYAGPTFDALPTYAQNFAWFYRDAPPPGAGPFIAIESDPGRNPNYRSWSSAREYKAAGADYASIFWAALTAAVERGLPGADQAWNTVTRGLTNLQTWSNGFAVDPRYNRYPRNR